MLRLGGTLQAAAIPERTDASPVTNKQRRHGRNPSDYSGAQVWRSSLRACPLACHWSCDISRLVCALVSILVTGKLKETPRPAPSPPSRLFPRRRVCVGRALPRACVHVRSLALAKRPRETRGGG